MAKNPANVKKVVRNHECFQVTSSAHRCQPTLGYNVLITCEHGGMELPAGRPWHAQDMRLKNTHWAGDLGCAEFSRELGARLRVPALVTNFSRLIVDVNRPLEDATLFRNVADGIPIELNGYITASERQKRIDRYYRPYHEELAYLTHILNPAIILAIHSFTDNYEGNKREVEVGVLFNQHEALAQEIEGYFRDLGYHVRLNEPWSGKEGFMYAVSQVESDENKGIMLEFRQDLMMQPKWRNRLMDNVEALLSTRLSHLRHTPSLPKQIQKGDRLPPFDFTTLIDGTATKVSSKSFFENKKVVLFAVPGAFTPGCSKEHFPSFVKLADKIKEKGVDSIACTSVNDAFVLDAWAKDQGAGTKITMLGDGNGDFARAIGLLQNAYQFGMASRSKRYAMIVKNGVVDWLGVDEKGVNVSKAESVLQQLG